MGNSISHEQGFTIIEMIITIVIIGMLAVLVSFAPKSFLVTSRDAERADDVASIARRLEQAYLNQDLGSPGYPSTTKLASDITTDSGTMSRINPEIFKAPRSTTSSVIAATSMSYFAPAGTGQPTIKQYVYQPIKVDAAGVATLCTVSTDICTEFALYYRHEATNVMKSIKSIHQQ